MKFKVKRFALVRKFNLLTPENFIFLTLLIILIFLLLLEYSLSSETLELEQGYSISLGNATMPMIIIT